MSDLVLRDEAQAPALLDRAERALELVTEPDEAEQLWRMLTAVEDAARVVRAHADIQLRAGRLKLRSERRWGELLGPAEHVAGPGRGKTVSAANRLNAKDKVARHVAREVADVEPKLFERFLERTTDPEKLRRARLLRLEREREAEQRAAAPVEPVEITDVDLRHGDLRSALDDLDGVDAIVTDPPYGADWLDEYDALGELAARLLRPGGVLVVMVGPAHLPAILERLGRHMEYRWCGAYLMPGPAARVWGRDVGTKWKPILIYGGDRFLTQDVFGSLSADKNHHEWGQSESGMADIVERTTEAGELVVDPFLGAGTTAVVCQKLGRRFVGCDIDEVAVAKARLRFAS